MSTAKRPGWGPEKFVGILIGVTVTGVGGWVNLRTEVNAHGSAIVTTDKRIDKIDERFDVFERKLDRMMETMMEKKT